MQLWSPAAAANALKTTIGILLAWAIVLWFQWPDPFLAPIAVLFLQTPYLGASLRKGLMRVFGTLAGALLVLLLLAFLIQDRWSLIAALSAVLAVAVYMIRSSRYGYAWFMLAITVVIIAAEAADQPQLAFELAVYRTSEAIVGILVVLTVNGILWPTMAGSVYARAYDTTARGLAAYLRDIGKAIARKTEPALVSPPQTLLRAPVQLRDVLTAAALDSGGFRRLRLTYEAQIQGITALLGSATAFVENLRLAAEGEGAFLTSDQRGVLEAVLSDVALALEAVHRRSSDASRESAVALVRARQGHDRLLAERSVGGRTGSDESAVLHALAGQLAVIVDDIERLRESTNAIASGRSLPAWQLPHEVRASLTDRVGQALPYALVMATAFWVLILLWIGLQWPPVGFIGALMAVVVIGIETLQNIPAQHPGRRVTTGAAVGLVITAPIYLFVMPQLQGFFELALALFPFYFVITYFFHALPPPHQLPLLGIGLIAILMVQLEPQQTYDAAGYVATSLSVLTGFVVGITLLAIFGGVTPQERLRRTLKDLLETLALAQSDLAERCQPGFVDKLARYEQRLRAGLQSLYQVAPLAYLPQVPWNDRARIDALLDATETLTIRFRALHHARARWSGADGPDSETFALGRMLQAPLEDTFRGFAHMLDQPHAAASLDALDAARPRIRVKLAAIEAQRRDGTDDTGARYLLTIAGHYVTVAHALRAFAVPLGTIDWAAWRQPRF